MEKNENDTNSSPNRNAVSNLQSESPDEAMNTDDNDSSEESDSSEDFENLEDVERLAVKGSKEVFESKDTPPDPTLDEKQTSEDVAQIESLSEKTEEERVLDESSEKERDDLSSVGAEVKKEEERREGMKVLLSGYLELKTSKEIERAMLNEKKITSQWLYPFRAAYQKEWELEMKKLKLGFQKALDYKKSHIHAIQREQKMVELNQLWADSAHYRISEELFDFMRVGCEKLKNRYLEELEETKNYYLEREREIVDKCTKAEERVRALVLMRKSVHEKTLQKTHETLQSFKHEGEFFREKEMRLIQEKHLTYVEMIAQELQTSISPPEHRMEEIRALFEEWKSKYEVFLKDSEKNRKELEKFGDELPRLEAKVSAARKELEDLESENKLTKQKETEEILRLQKIAKKYESIRPPMRKMISASEKVMVKLREREAKLDKIMKLKKFCDQLERGSDTMCPQGNLLDSREVEQIEENDCLPLIRDMCSEEIEDHNLLQNLHRKLSRVKLQNQFLQREVKNLKIERMALKSDMKKYLHLIVSGEWQRIPDSKFQELSELDRSESDQNQNKNDSNDHIAMNLQLLNKRYRSMNDEIIKRVEL